MDWCSIPTIETWDPLKILSRGKEELRLSVKNDINTLKGSRTSICVTATTAYTVYGCVGIDVQLPKDK